MVINIQSLESGIWSRALAGVTEFFWSPSVILALCHGSFSYWKVNLSSRLRFCSLWMRFSSKISLYLAAFIIPSIQVVLSLLKKKEKSSVLVSSDQRILFLIVYESILRFFFGQTQCGFSHLAHWGEVSVIRLWLMESCSDSWLIETYWNLHAASLELSQNFGFFSLRLFSN